VLFERLLKLSILKHLCNYVAASNKFSFHVHLRDGGPVSVLALRWTCKHMLGTLTSAL
jgi:hypothetical protein